MERLLKDAEDICLKAIGSCLPDKGVREFLSGRSFPGDVYLVAVGKAAFSMAKAAVETVSVKKGIIVSKYGHIPEKLDNIENREAGHPIPDANSLKAAQDALKMCEGLKESDTVLFLLSGGASALFEYPLVSLDKLKDISDQMLKKGLDIIEINTIRKRLSLVKGGRFAAACAPAHVCSIILSDVLSDRIDMIGSGPTVNDCSTAEEAMEIIGRYGLELSDEAMKALASAEDVSIDDGDHAIIGSVRKLCAAAAGEAARLGYRPVVISDHLNMDVEDAGDMLEEEIRKHSAQDEDTALIFTGENTVKVRGGGLGGRAQHLILYMSRCLKDMDDVLVMSLGSDGTDGPTDAAGAYADRNTWTDLEKAGIDGDAALRSNDSYHALKKIGRLIFTGPTGTNVNDICVALIKRSV